MSNLPRRGTTNPTYVGIAKGEGLRRRQKTYVYFMYYDRGRRCMVHWKGQAIWFEGFTLPELRDLILSATRKARAEKDVIAARWAKALAGKKGEKRDTNTSVGNGDRTGADRAVQE